MTILQLILLFLAIMVLLVLIRKRAKLIFGGLILIFLVAVSFTAINTYVGETTAESGVVIEKYEDIIMHEITRTTEKVNVIKVETKDVSTYAIYVSKEQYNSVSTGDEVIIFIHRGLISDTPLNYRIVVDKVQES